MAYDRVAHDPGNADAPVGIDEVAMRRDLGAAGVFMLQGTKENSLCNLAPDATPSARLPLIDRAAVRDWCEDLAPDDIVEILAGVPGEARKGIEEIRQAINSSDLARVKRVAHRMKGMAANIGAPLLAQIARDIEGATGSIEIVAKQLPILEQILSDTLEALSTLR